jgi:hypothetical protein
VKGSGSGSGTGSVSVGVGSVSVGAGSDSVSLGVSVGVEIGSLTKGVSLAGVSSGSVGLGDEVENMQDESEMIKAKVKQINRPFLFIVICLSIISTIL